MEPLSSTYPPNSTSSSSNEQKLINRETSLVELPPDSASRPTAAVGQDDEPSAGDRGDASVGTDALSPALPPVPAPPAIPSSTSTSPPITLAAVIAPSSSSPSQQQHPHTQQHSPAAQSERPSSVPQESEIQRVEGQALEKCQEEPTSTSRDAGATMTEVKEGDKVAWNWGSGAPGGVASEVVTDGEAKMVSHRGNEVKKQGSPDNPAVHVERSGNDVVKKASELEVEEKGPKHGSGGGEEKKDEEGEKKENGEAKTGEKRSADEANKGDDEKASGEKKDEAKANGDAGAQQPPKKKGRPAKSEGGAKKETKQKKAPKPAATADGKPRRSGRNKG